MFFVSKNWDPFSVLQTGCCRVCGQASFCTLKYYCDEVFSDPTIKIYLSEVTSLWCRCRGTSYAQLYPIVPSESSSLSFNHTIRVNHIFLDANCMFHVIVTKTYSSADSIRDDMLFENFTYAHTVCWLMPFWTFNAVCVDDVFNHTTFIGWISGICSTFEPVPSGHHQNNLA